MTACRGLMVLGSNPKAGRTTTCIGLTSVLSNTSKVGFLQWGSQDDSLVEVKNADNEKYEISKDVITMKEGTAITSCYDEMKFTNKALELKNRFESLCKVNDYVIVSAIGHSFTTNFDISNIDLADLLSVPVVTVCTNSSDVKLHSNLSVSSSVKTHTILNKSSLSSSAVATIPHSPILSEVTIHDVFLKLRETKSCSPQYFSPESDKKWSPAGSVRLVTTAIEIFKMSDITAKTLFVVSASRQDLVRLIVLELHRRGLDNTCSIVLVSDPSTKSVDHEAVFAAISLELPETFPAFHIFGHPVSVAAAAIVASQQPPPLQFANTRKMKEIKKLYSNIDVSSLLSVI